MAASRSSPFAQVWVTQLRPFPLPPSQRQFSLQLMPVGCSHRLRQSLELYVRLRLFIRYLEQQMTRLAALVRMPVDSIWYAAPSVNFELVAGHMLHSRWRPSLVN